ncbi:hypothetical protein EJP82_14045 [Paenibacillus anaericanus]|uniref:Intracellular proteinase inhibitor BsuPI domain-containing protein n=1 Tax=Paenibacillus anaericanus TaxID=170367 RepID=A0A3S1EGU3_9BACL|nr:hypothetical protein [Paenibacillus anaericanus]RUT45422.1 hypothetical protein EJP82_14045 [Paenibacillus anaericanus]
MTKIRAFLLMLVLVMATIFTGCAKTTTESLPDLVGSIKVVNIDSDTTITYTFKNQSDKKVTVIGGASYKLLMNDQLAEEGGVPIKDYIELEPGKEYTDTKTFSNLEPGSYTIYVDWDKTIVSAKFDRS